MNFRALQHTHLLAAVLFLAAILVLAIQLITPSPVMVSLGGDGTQTTTVGEYFTYREVAVIATAAFACGSSGTYLIIHNQAHVLTQQNQDQTHSPVEITSGVAAPTEQSNHTVNPPADEERWEKTLETLSNNQEIIYELLIEADGELAQRNLVEETDLSKATVSRTLDKLEHRELVERKRSGMGNTIHLQ
ncbi:helix-turn-helix transcriptional regulator [Halostagnicola kamekurae]|uniref:MarR family protein n=1 Tax=Halostagnicola kamekurae TaxID=619731 RepID=A0A1I6QP12_9EURY|nr:MarR family transcriptional regulator [Halostagnicola kamekurae]SFS54193.1 MarR family protein [Halostagnicola kamekurae]